MTGRSVVPNASTGPALDEAQSAPMNRYLATYVSSSRYDRDTKLEVYARDDAGAMEAARAATPSWWRKDRPPAIYISGPLHASADCNGGTRGD